MRVRREHDGVAARREDRNRREHRAGRLQLHGGGKKRVCAPIRSQRSAIARFNPDGSLDQGFGKGGGLVDFRSTAYGFDSLALQSDILVAGASGNPGFQLFRYRADGTIDPTNGPIGIVESPPIAPAEPRFHLEAHPTAILPLADDSLAVAVDGRATTKYAVGSFMAAVSSFADGYKEELGRIDAAPGGDPSFVSAADLVQLADGRWR